MVGAGGAGLNFCSGFKALHGPTNSVRLWVYLFRRGPATMRSNHICFQVTSTGPFTADWNDLLAPQAPSLSWVFPYNPYLFPGFVSFPQSSSGLPSIIHVLPTTGLSMGISIAHQGWGRLQCLGFHSFSECGPIMASAMGS